MSTVALHQSGTTLHGIKVGFVDLGASGMEDVTGAVDDVVRQAGVGELVLSQQFGRRGAPDAPRVFYRGCDSLTAAVSMDQEPLEDIDVGSCAGDAILLPPPHRVYLRLSRRYDIVIRLNEELVSSASHRVFYRHDHWNAHIIEALGPTQSGCAGCAAVFHEERAVGMAR